MCGFRFRHSLLLLACILGSCMTFAQTISGRIEPYTLHSENGAFHMVSLPYDNVEQTDHGVTYVYETGRRGWIYKVDRHFNFVGFPNHITLSNDGETIFYLNAIYENDAVAERNTITVYQHGQLRRSYTVQELTGCDPRESDCSLLYYDAELVNAAETKWKDGRKEWVWNDNAAAIDRFAIAFRIFSQGDSLYLIDRDRKLRIFSLRDGALCRTEAYDAAFQRLQPLGRKHDLVAQRLKSPSSYDLPSLADGKQFGRLLGKKLGMTEMDGVYDNLDRFKCYRVDIEIAIDGEGQAEVYKLEVDSGIPEQAVRDLLTSVSFDRPGIPSPLEKWIYRENLVFRKASKALAKKERRAELQVEARAARKRMTADSINGLYIPENLAVCFPTLDSLLTPKQRADFKALPSRDATIRYHHGLGMWLRNNWSLWGGSRLQTYFLRRGIGHPDAMTPVILEHYWDWLHGQRETWKTWEKGHPDR